MKWEKIIEEINAPTNAPTNSVVLSSTKKKKGKSNKDITTPVSQHGAGMSAKPFKSKKSTFNLFRGSR